MEVVAVALATVTSLMDERADNMDAEPANAPLFCRLLQIRPAESEGIERLAVVDETYPEAARPPPERHGDGSSRRMRSVTMRYGIGEELIENDQESRSLVIRQTALMRELIGKGSEPVNSPWSAHSVIDALFTEGCSSCCQHPVGLVY